MEEESDRKKYAKTCIECGKDFTAGHGGAKFCSNKCKKVDHYARMKALNGNGAEQAVIFSKPTIPNGVPKNAQVQIMSTLPPAAALMVELIRKESERWETAFNQERELRRKLKEANEKFRNELAEIKTDNRIKAIEDKKPGGLSGLMENPIMTEVVIPNLGKLVDRLMSTPMQIGGADGQLDSTTKSQLTKINAWYATLQPEEQESVYELLQHFASAPSGEARMEVINRMKNLLSNGSTITNMPTGTSGIL